MFLLSICHVSSRYVTLAYLDWVLTVQCNHTVDNNRICRSSQHFNLLNKSQKLFRYKKFSASYVHHKLFRMLCTSTHHPSQTGYSTGTPKYLTAPSKALLRRLRYPPNIQWKQGKRMGITYTDDHLWLSRCWTTTASPCCFYLNIYMYVFFKCTWNK